MVPWRGAILNLGMPVSDRCSIDNLATGLPRCAGRLASPHNPTAAQMSQQLFLQYATGLNKQALIDCPVADLHGLVSIERDLEPSRYLLR